MKGFCVYLRLIFSISRTLYDNRTVERLEGPNSGFEEVSLTTIVRSSKKKTKSLLPSKPISGITPNRQK
jgi:hypothetical protein